MTNKSQTQPSEIRHPYFDSIHNLLEKIEQTQMPAIHAAAHLFAETIINEGIIHIFGSGHSHIIAEEAFFRAGGLVQVNAILDPGLMLHLSAAGSTILERLPGYATIILDRYSFEPADLMVVISNSGRNSAPVEAAIYGHNKGLKVVALTSVESYKQTTSRHPSGKLLPEFSDVIIDTCTPEGDAALRIDGLPEAIGPTSTILGASIINSIIYEAVKEVLSCGKEPSIFTSANVDSNTSLVDSLGKFKERVRHS